MRAVIVAFVVLVAYLAGVVWTIRKAGENGHNQLFWGIVALVIGPIGALLYAALMIPRGGVAVSLAEPTSCPKCSSILVRTDPEDGRRTCAQCGCTWIANP